MTRNSRFQYGSGVYVCACCQRKTRETGVEGGSGYCALCVEIMGIDNTINDNGLDGAEAASYRAECETLLAQIIAKGGNAERVKRVNTFVWPTGSKAHG